MGVRTAAKQCAWWRKTSLAAALAAALLALTPVMPVQAAVKKSAPVASKALKKSVAQPAKAGKKAGAKAAKKRQGAKMHVTLRGAKGKRRVAAAAPVRRVSVGSSLPRTVTPMELSASVAYVLDQDTHEVLLSRNESAVLPIASITKLMTGLLIAEANLPMDEFITITDDDVDTLKGSSSRLPVGTTLTRGELLHLALMSSENRAAHALGRTYPGGLQSFVSLMNARAMMLGMHNTRYVEPTGLSSANRSSARDLAMLVAEAARYPLLRELTTWPEHEVAVGGRVLQYGNTNRLVHSPDWNIALQKTGYISEAGRCVVMFTRMAGRQLVMVLLDAPNTRSRLADAERVRHWVEEERPARTVAERGHSW